MSADGRRILVARDFGIARDVAIVDAAGNTRSIYSVPQPEQNQVQHASIDGKYAVIDLQRLPRNANGVLGTDLAVVLVNIVTGTAKNIDAISEQDIRHGGRTIDGSLIADGQVYWDFHSAYGNHAGVVKDYDVATGRTRVVYRGTVGTPMMTAFGISVSWGAQGHLVIPRTVPAPVLNALPAHARQSSPAFDGSSYAWIVGRRIGWWGPGQSQATEVTFPERVQPGLVAVAGPFVLFTDANTLNPSAPDQVLDARSGAVSILSGLQPYALSSEGVLAGYRFVHGFKTSPTEPVRIDTNALPPLTC